MARMGLMLRLAPRVLCVIRNGLSHSAKQSPSAWRRPDACFSRVPRHLKRLFSAHHAKSAVRPAFFQHDS
jgi:hypothetical protein